MVNWTVSTLLSAHEMLRHLDFDVVRKLLNLPPASRTNPNPVCESCQYARMREKKSARQGVASLWNGSHQGVYFLVVVAGLSLKTVQNGVEWSLNFTHRLEVCERGGEKGRECMHADTNKRLLLTITQLLEV